MKKGDAPPLAGWGGVSKWGTRDQGFLGQGLDSREIQVHLPKTPLGQDWGVWGLQQYVVSGRHAPQGAWGFALWRRAACFVSKLLARGWMLCS